MNGSNSCSRPKNSLFTHRGSGAATNQPSPKNHLEVASPPEDSVSSLAFSPNSSLSSSTTSYLIAGSWDSNIRCWEVQQNGQTIPRAEQTHLGPVLDVAWGEDATKVFSSSIDKTVKIWDLNTNQSFVVAQHDAPIKTVNLIKTPTYNCIMTGSWDKTIKFWDCRAPHPIAAFCLPERVYCVDVVYPMAVVCTAGNEIFVYNLQNQPKEYKRIACPIKYQLRSVAIFKDKTTMAPVGFALGSTEGRVAIQFVDEPKRSFDNYSFKCHRINDKSHQDIYAINDIKFHPAHGTFATVGSDGHFYFWDKDTRSKMMSSKKMDKPITAACFDSSGHTFAYATSYDWSKGYNYNTCTKKSSIFLHSCFNDMKPKRLK